MLGENNHDGTQNGKHELLLRRLGYFAGIQAIDQLTHGVAIRGTSPESVVSAKKFEEYVSKILRHKSLAAIENMDPADDKLMAKMLALYARFQDARQGEGNQTSGYINYVENVQAMMKSLPWTIGPKGVPRR